MILVFAFVVAACTGADQTSEGFCTKLAEVTGPAGIESTLLPGDPDRIDGVVGELAELHDRAPDEISTTTRTLLGFFRSYQRAARDERRDVIADNEIQLSRASAYLDDYALRECGLFLERTVPTPIPTAREIVEAPND